MSTTNEMLDGEAYQNASDLADELSEMQLMSTSDRKVRARLLPPVQRDGDIVVQAKLPDGDVVSREFDKPKPWSDRYEFARFVEAYGYGPDSIMNLAGEEVTVERTRDEEWRIVHPDPSGANGPNTDKLRGLFAGLMSAPVAAAYGLYGPKMAIASAFMWVMFAGIIYFDSPEDD